MTNHQELPKAWRPHVMRGIAAFIGITCFIILALGYYLEGIILFGVSGGIFLLVFLVKQSKKSKYTPQWSTDSSPAPLFTINSTAPSSYPPPPSYHHRPSHTTSPTGRRPSPSSVSLSSQLSHAYYTNSSTFSSLSPYIASQSIDERNRITSPTTQSPSTSTSVILGFTPSEAAQRHSAQQAANQPPPAYPEVVDNDSQLPPEPYTTPATGDGYGEVFGPSSDGLPSYETVVATMQPRGDSPPPYAPS